MQRKVTMMEEFAVFSSWFLKLNPTPVFLGFMTLIFKISFFSAKIALYSVKSLYKELFDFHTYNLVVIRVEDDVTIVVNHKHITVDSSLRVKFNIKLSF